MSWCAFKKKWLPEGGGAGGGGGEGYIPDSSVNKHRKKTKRMWA